MQLCQSSGIESDHGKSKPWDDDTLAREHCDGFRILIYSRVKNQSFDVIDGVEGFEVHSIYVQVDNLATWVIQLIRTCIYLFLNFVHISFEEKTKKTFFYF